MDTIRPLRETDKEDVLEIARHTWDGHDYLPHSFDSWLKDEDSHTVVIERNGHVVALANLRVIEGGTTGWMEGLRVHHEHRGKGLATIVTKQVLKMAKEIPVERVRYTTAVDNVESLHLGGIIGMKRKFDMAIHWQDLSEKIKWSSSVLPVHAEAPEELLSDLLSAKIVPNGVIIYDWKALDVNIESLGKVSLLSKLWVQRDKGNLTSFSLGFPRPAKDGPQWRFTVYARDESSLLDQISHQLDQARASSCKTIFMTYPVDFVQVLSSLEWFVPFEGAEMALTLLERVS